MDHENKVILGIDLGTTNSLGATFRDGVPVILRDNENEDGIIPSVVSFQENGVVVGKAALESYLDYPDTTIYSAKRYFGKTFEDLEDDLKNLPFEITGDDKSLKFKIKDKEVYPLEVSSHVLRAVKDKAERVLDAKVEKAVITVPAYFDDNQRQETRAAAQAAGLEVARIVNEPTAAALAYGIDQMNEGKVAVYDLGGGTFDISILDLKDGVFKVLSTHGDTFLGGDDFDQKIVEWMIEQARSNGQEFELDSHLLILLKFAAEEAKKRLSQVEELPLDIEFKGRGFHLDAVLTRENFEKLIRKEVRRTLRSCKSALKDAALKAEDITQVVLVGGSTRIPLIREMVKDFFDTTPYVGINPDEVVALGAAVQAQILAGGKRDVLLLDVVPLSLGIETLGGAVTKVLMNNTTIPASHTETFTTSVDNQTGIVLHVLQGERELVEDCRSLGKFNVKVPPMPAGLPKLHVTFQVDENGMLTVSADEERSGQKATIEIAPTIGLSQDEMNRIIEDSIENAMDDFQLRMVVELRNKAERVVVATERSYEKAYQLMEKEEVEEIKVWVEKAKAALTRGEKDQEVLEEIVEKLGDLTRPLADLLFNQATREALVGKTVQDV